jgi:hypothetical protein
MRARVLYSRVMKRYSETRRSPSSGMTAGFWWMSPNDSLIPNMKPTHLANVTLWLATRQAAKRG